MLRRFASVVAGGALALTSYSVMAGAPAFAGEKKNTVEVTKVVKGENIGGGYTVAVTCRESENHDLSTLNHNGPKTETLTFPPEGGTDSVKVGDDKICEVEETGTGGASNVEISGSPCDFTDTESVTAKVDEGKTCKVTVTNTFVKAEAGPAGPAGPQGPAGESAVSPAQAVVSTARFTG
jgi:hypothetical protein